MNADGSDQTRLTFDGANGSPVWSPDGTKIAWVRGSRLWVMNPDGSGQTALTPEPMRVVSPDWQSLLGPRRADYKNAAHFCKAERDFWGEDFAERYGGGANAYGKCVSGK